MYDAVLTAMNNVVISRVEMTVRSITGSSGIDLSSRVQNPDQRDFKGNTETTPLRSASSRLDLNIEQGEIDEARDIDDSEDGEFPATRFNYDWRAYAHHNHCRHHHLKFSFFKNLIETAATEKKQLFRTFYLFVVFSDLSHRLNATRRYWSISCIVG